MPAQYDENETITADETCVLVRAAGSVVIREAIEACGEWRLAPDEYNPLEALYQRRRMSRIEEAIAALKQSRQKRL